MTAALAALGAVLSMLASGFVFGVGEAARTLPLTDGLTASPAFAEDSAVQSLLQEPSSLLNVLAGTADVVAAPTLHLLLFIATRLLAMTGLLMLARQLGVRKLAPTLVLTVLLALTPLLQGFAADEGSLFVDHFSVTALAASLALFVWHALLRGRVGMALAISGLVFACDPATGLWQLAPVAFVGLALRQGGHFRHDRARVELLAGLALGLVVALPGLRAVVAISPAATPGSLPADVTVAQWLTLLGFAVTAAMTLRLASHRATAALVVLVGFLAVMVAGVALPVWGYPSMTQTWRLLGAASAVQALAALGWGVLVVNALFSGGPGRERLVWAPLLLLAGMLHPWGALMLPVVVLARSLNWPASASLDNVPGLLGLVLGVCAFLTLHTIEIRSRVVAVQDQVVSEWESIGRSLRDRSERQAASTWVLLPLSHHTSGHEPDTAALLRYFAQRRPWVDGVWGSGHETDARQIARLEEVRQLRGWGDKLAYARRNGISFVVDRCPAVEFPEGSARLVSRAGHWCAFQVIP